MPWQLIEVERYSPPTVDEVSKSSLFVIENIQECLFKRTFIIIKNDFI